MKKNVIKMRTKCSIELRLMKKQKKSILPRLIKNNNFKLYLKKEKTIK